MEGVLALLIPVLALSIPVVAIVFNGLHKTARLRIEESRARTDAPGAGGAGRIDALEAEIGELRHELGEVQERLDFTERMLAQQRERQRLPDAGER